MGKKEERILITKCSSDCRYLRFMDGAAELAGIEPGYYCAYYPHGGWERIEPKDCKKCKRDKLLSGITREEALERIAEAIYEFCRKHRPEGYLWYPKNNRIKDIYRACAEAALDALLK